MEVGWDKVQDLMTSVKKLCTEVGVSPVGLCYTCPKYNWCNLALLGSEAQGTYERFVLGIFMVSLSVGMSGKPSPAYARPTSQGIYFGTGIKQ